MKAILDVTWRESLSETHTQIYINIHAYLYTDKQKRVFKTFMSDLKQKEET